MVGRSRPAVLRSHWFSLTVSSSLLGSDGAAGAFRCSLWLPGLPAFSDVRPWLGLYTDMILLLILWFWRERVAAAKATSPRQTLRDKSAGSPSVRARGLGALVNSWRNYCRVYRDASHVSLPAMWCSPLDWQTFIKKSNTWPHVCCTDESALQPYQKQY